MTKALLALATALLAPMMAVGGQAPAALRASVDLVISGKQYGLTMFSWMRANAAGDVAVVVPGRPEVRILKADGRDAGTIARDGDGPGALAAVSQLGWVADSVWVVDVRLDRWSLFSPDRAFVRMLTVPRHVVGPAGTEPINYPAPVSPNPQFVPPNSFVMGGGFLVSATLGGSRDRQSVVVHVDEHGGYLNTIGLYNPDDSHCWVSISGVPARLIPFCRSPLTASSANGTYFVNAQGYVAGKDSGTARIVQTDLKGDTLIAVTISVPTVPMVAGAYDSASRSLLAQFRQGRMDGNVIQQVQQEFKKAQPALRQPVLRVLVGNDGMVCVEVAGTTAEHNWLILDAKGRTIGPITLPAGVRLMQIGVPHLWGLRIALDGSADIIRYRIDGLH